MIMGTRIATTIEQSKKLMELGIDVNTADMNYIGHELISYPYCESKFKVEENVYPAWSLSALLELIPESIDEYTDSFSQLEITKKSVSYVYANGMLRKGFLKDNLLDAAFEMVSYLLEHDLIK